MFVRETVKLSHKTGTKEYEISTVQSPKGFVLIFRWGKTGTFGQIQAQAFSNKSSAENAAVAKMNDKMKGGYSPNSGRICKDYASFNEMMASSFRPYAQMLPPDVAEMIDPSLRAFARGKNVTQDFEDIKQNGLQQTQRTAEAKAEYNRLLAAQAEQDKLDRLAKEKADLAERQAKDPLWGMF